MITFSHKGDLKKTINFLTRAQKVDIVRILDKYGKEGVNALASATPVDSGLTAASWIYEIRDSGGSVSIIWKNTNIVNGVPIAIILQYGHATGTGGFVQGRDYINPAIQPIFDKIADEVWGEVTKS